MADKTVVKYGMPATESEPFVNSHFVVMEERKQIARARMERALRNCPELSAALSKVGKR
jgi:hypothetical protein